MSIAAVLLLAVALGTDSFSLCLGIGLAGVRRAQVYLISFTVLLFHIFMPLLGWYAGEYVGSLLGRWAGYIGAAVLLYLGVKMIRGGLHPPEENPRPVSLNTAGLLLLAASVSMDALSVGFTLGTQRVNLLATVLTFGIVAGLMTCLGLVLGKLLGRLAGARAQLLGGLILLGIGIKLVV